MNKIGYQCPDDAGDIVDVVTDTMDEDGMIFEIHESGVVGAYNDDVGLVTYYRFQSIDAAYEYIANRED